MLSAPAAPEIRCPVRSCAARLRDDSPRDGPDQSSTAGAGNNARVTTAAPSLSQRVHSLNRPNMVSVGTIVWLSSELMFFAGLFAMFFTVKAQNDTGEWPPPPNHLDVPYALVVTIVLVASSFTCQMGVCAAERGDVFGLRRWYTITLVMGALFVLGQANEYRSLISEGTTIPASAYGTVFYLTTGFHGLHVTGGLIAFVFLLARTRMSKFTPAQATSAIVVSYYWHFVDVVWIGLFSVISFVK
jgi:cytochrome c oxidase subunit III